MCDVCENEISLTLMADYCSTGIWCKYCGVEMSSDDNIGNIPEWIISLVKLWVSFWDSSERDPSISLEYRKRIYFENGYILAKLISEYYPCELKEII